MKTSNVIIAILALLIIIMAGITINSMSLSNQTIKNYSYDPGDFFITNVQDSGALIKSDIVIELSSSDTLKILEDNQFKVRDLIINILRRKTLNEVMQADCLKILKEEIKSELESYFSISGVEGIFFNEFVIQQ